MNNRAFELIQKFEGCRLKAYPDLGGVWTVGYGATGSFITKGTVWTQGQANLDLMAKVAVLSGQIEKLLKVPQNDNQKAALISFAYNVGIGALTRSTLLKMINNEQENASHQFLKWTKVKGKFVKGLFLRRSEEREVYESSTQIET